MNHTTTSASGALIAGALCLALGPATLSGQESAGRQPTAEDRAGIERLLSSYPQALGSCAAEDYARNFESPDGFYESSFRGRVQGFEKLVALVESEGHCNDGSTVNTREPFDPAALSRLEMTADGATGIVSLGDRGHYQDVYVKTPSGWRFRSRTNISAQARAAGVTARDLAEIRVLAGEGQGRFADIYADMGTGRHFRSSGVVVVEIDGPRVRGRVQLKNDGGRYDDVYVRTGGGWRFESRTYVPATASR